MKFININ